MTEPPLTFLHAGRIPQCVATVEKKFDYCLLQMKTSGGIKMWTEDQQLEMHGAFMWVCRPARYYKIHEIPPGSPWNHRYIAFTGPLALQWEANGLLEFLTRAIPMQQVAAWAERFDMVIDESQRRDRWGRLRGINRLEGMLLDLVQPGKVCRQDMPEWLVTIVSKMECFDVINYESLANDVNMSLSTFQRKFRKITGLSPHAYFLRLRINEAKRLLVETDLPIKMISGQLGYNDLFYFTRQFKRVVGTPPGAYRCSRQELTCNPPRAARV